MPLAYQPLPPEVTGPLLRLAGQMITLSGYFAVAAILCLTITATLRYTRGAPAIDLWKELVVILLCAAVAANTFAIADWAH